MKKILPIALLLIVALLNTQQMNASTINDNKKETGYISLNTNKEIEVEPNIAKITFAVENTASDAQKATYNNNETTNIIINALKTITNQQTDIIKTNNFSVRPIYGTSSGKRVIKNYSAVNSIIVETKDITKVSKLIDIAITNGSNRVDGLTYRYDKEKEICEKLYPTLVSDLRKQATILAQAAGTTLNGLKHLSASCNMNSVVSNGRFYAKGLSSMDTAIPENTQTPLEAGKVKINVYISTDFYVK